MDDFTTIKSFWADFQRGSVLITSRETLPRLQALSSSGQGAELKPFTPPEGLELVKRRLGGRIAGKFNDSIAAELAQRLLYFPLWMDHVMAFIGESRMTLDQFNAVSMPLDDHELQDVSVDSEWHRSSVAAAIEDHVAKLDSVSRHTLTTIAFFDPDKIPQKLLVSVDGQVSTLSSQIKCEKLLVSLSRYSYVSLNGGEGIHDRCISVHRLVRDAALRLSRSPQAAFNDAISLLRQCFPLQGQARDHVVEYWDDCEAFQPHVLSLHQRYLELKQTEKLQPSFEFIELVYSCAWWVLDASHHRHSCGHGPHANTQRRYLCERGRLNLSESLISSISGAYRELAERGSVNPTFLADIYTVQLFYHTEATHGTSFVDLATKALKLREEAVAAGTLDKYHPNRANGFMNLGVALAQDNPHEAIKKHMVALDIRYGSEKYQSEQRHGLALNYLNLGRCWLLVQEFENAASCFRECLTVMKACEARFGKRFPL